jgi:hypothetical protein
MPANRTPLRRYTRARITPEAITHFLEIERSPKQRRAYSDGSHRLARLLGLVPEWWGGCHVNDRSEQPHCGPEYGAFADWHRCRAVREALLEAAGKRPN